MTNLKRAEDDIVKQIKRFDDDVASSNIPGLLEAIRKLIAEKKTRNGKLRHEDAKPVLPAEWNSD